MTLLLLGARLETMGVAPASGPMRRRKTHLGAFFDILSGIDPVLIHMAISKQILKKMCDRYGGPKNSPRSDYRIIVNLCLRVRPFTFPHIPSLEDARFLSFEWSDPLPPAFNHRVAFRWESRADLRKTDRL
jgi:hypothetical protein